MMKPFDNWSKEDRRRAQAAISDLADRMRRATQANGVPAEKADELLRLIANLAPCPDDLLRKQ
jgi:hypothetical protein